MSALHEAVIAAVTADRGELCWPLLACLERLDTAVATLPKRKRGVARAELSELRETILFELHALATGIADSVERRVAVEAISRARP